MSSAIIHAVFVACDHLIVLLFFFFFVVYREPSNLSNVYREPASGTLASVLALSLLQALHLSSPSLLWITASGPLGELSKYVCVAKTKRHLFLLLVLRGLLYMCACERFGLRRAVVKSLEVQQDSLYS